MGAFAKGDVVLFPFPYTDLSNRKLRPCLVISEEMGEDVILCQITSKHVSKDRYSVEIKKNDALDGSLHIDSYVRANMVFTANKVQILKKVCTITDEQYKKVTDIINDIIRK